MIYIITTIIYLLNAGLYLWYSPALKLLYPHEFSLWYFGTESIFMPLFMWLAYKAKWWYQKCLVGIIGIYVLARGILYMLNDSLIWIEQGRWRMFILSVVTLVFIILFIKNGRKYGFIHRDN